MTLADRYLEAMRALPAGELKRSHLMTPELRLHREARFSIYYAPFDYINRPARVALVGITPGWQQMEIAFRVARARLAGGTSVEQALRAVKAEASFAGMRQRMCGWLDELDLPGFLGLTSSAELFGAGRHLLHTTSAVRYPVIKSDGENWTGSGPSPTSSPVLRRYVHDLLAPELAQVENAFVIPLGVAVTKALNDLVAGGKLDERRVLANFPHPSGLNTRGPAVFAKRRDTMIEQVRVWFGGSRPPGAQSPVTPAAERDGARSERARPRPSGNVASRSPARNAVSGTALPGREQFEALIVRALCDLGGRAMRHDIKARALEFGAFSEAQLRVPPPPSKVGSYPSQVAYRLDWAMNALKNSRQIRSPARRVWELTPTGRGRAGC